MQQQQQAAGLPEFKAADRCTTDKMKTNKADTSANMDGRTRQDTDADTSQHDSATQDKATASNVVKCRMVGDSQALRTQNARGVDRMKP